MGTHDERLTALKKAYADIILNTSKEAAARIMASERKALRFQHELQVVKEDALRTLLRIKQIMDEKISEAETTRLSQQTKIEELEAQLHEAEDIVSDLRGELRDAQDALERVKVNKESRESAFCASDLHDVHVAVSDIRIVNPSTRSEGLKSCSRAVHHTGSSYLSHPDLLPSIILRSKEPELYRNGCTQRIRACEGNMLGKKMSISRRKTEELKPESDDNKEVSAIPDDADKKVVKEGDSFVFSGSFQRKKRRAKRCGKSRISLDGNHPPAPLFPMKTDDGQINNNSSSSFDDDDDEKKKEEENLAFLKSCSHKKRKRAGRQRKYRAALDRNLPVPVPGKDSSEVTPISSPDRDDSQHESHGVEKAVSEHEELVEAVVTAAVLETGSTGSSGITVHNKSDVEDAVVALLQSSSGSKVCDVAAPKDENRTFKYTFQRKRKRCENAAANSVHKNCNEVMKNEEENQNVVSKDQQPKWSAESSRDSRRMAQVARQLISLSEKKWWQ